MCFAVLSCFEFQCGCVWVVDRLWERFEARSPVRFV